MSNMFKRYLNEKRDTNKASSSISSSNPGKSVYFATDKDAKSFDDEYLQLVEKYNKIYHSYGDKKVDRK